MKENVLTIKDKKGNKKEYRILFNIESYEENKNYIICTDDTKNSKGEINVHALTYQISAAGNMTKLKHIEKKEEYDFLEKILTSLESENE
ncbi:MAG: DUF1292 domain-containing protein [Bacilli bacterium]|nr:DUF1292 domain-containing protein [Bacilli bacterium]